LRESGRSASVAGGVRLISLNVSRPKPVQWQGRQFQTGIFKESVDGPLRVGLEGFENDGVADLRVHGGVDKAVYAYPHEHYLHFQALLGRDDFVLGQFGENLTTTGMLESDVRIGDRFRIGSALFEVSQPREPCFKLGMRMNDPGFIKMFLQSLRTGFYLRVINPGDVMPGQTISLDAPADRSLTVRETVRLKHFDRDNVNGLRLAASLHALSPSWREEFAERLRTVQS